MTTNVSKIIAVSAFLIGVSGQANAMWRPSLSRLTSCVSRLGGQPVRFARSFSSKSNKNPFDKLADGLGTLLVDQNNHLADLAENVAKGFKWFDHKQKGVDQDLVSIKAELEQLKKANQLLNDKVSRLEAKSQNKVVDDLELE